jgi:hypothetical protein
MERYLVLRDALQMPEKGIGKVRFAYAAPVTFSLLSVSHPHLFQAR